MSNILQDIRYGARMLMKDPWATVVAALALALGIGLVTTQFSITNALMLKGLPFKGSERLCKIEWVDRHTEGRTALLGIHDFHDLREAQTSFEGLAAYYDGKLEVKRLASDEFGQRHVAAYISANFLDLLGVQPSLGRGFMEGEDEPGAEPVLLIGHDVWQRDFQGDPAILGQSVFVEGMSRTVVGVMPEGFGFPVRQEIWLPLLIDHLVIPREAAPIIPVFGRLKEGVSRSQAMAECDIIAQRIRQEHPDPDRAAYQAFEIKRYTDFLDPRGEYLLMLMLTAVFLVLLIACANVASLLLARASLRGKELAIRNALGASRMRLIRQMLTESLLLSFAGACGGIFLAQWGTYWAAYYIEPMGMPFWINLDLDLRCLYFALAVTLCTGVLCGLVPGLRSSKVKVSGTLKDNVRTSTSLSMGRFNRALVVVQLTLSCALLLVAAVIVQSLATTYDKELPFDPAPILSTDLYVQEPQFPTPEDVPLFWAAIFKSVGEVPGIEAVAATTRFKMSAAETQTVMIKGKDYPTEDDYATVYYETISHEYFDVLDVPILKGRSFAETDTAMSEPVALVNSFFAERHWPEQDPIGQRIRNAASPESPWMTVAGVVPDLEMEGMDNMTEKGPGVYVPLAQHPQRWMPVLIRARGDTLSLVPAVRSAILAVNRDQAVQDFLTLGRDIKDIRADEVFIGGSFAVFGLVALFLASIGVYGVISFSVSRRTHEIGIRMALGAQARSILWMIMKQGLVQLAIALVVGLTLGYGFLRLIANRSPTDDGFVGGILGYSFTYFIVAAILSAVALLATWRPARRASRVYPMAALRNE